ncbi:MAG: ferric reductase-like transmembrane domain-containing protein [Acidimicrobiales bacterium]
MDHVFWYVTRASGIIAWVLLTASVLWGVLMAGKVLGRRPGPKWMLDLHRFLGGAAVVLVGLHLGSLLLDSYTDFRPVDLVVPFASSWRPVAVAWGVLALYLLVAVEVSSLAMRRLPRKTWHVIHLSSYACFLLVSVHALTAGTDVANPVARFVGVFGLVAVTLLAALRIFTWRRTVARRAATTAPAAAPSPTVDWNGAVWADTAWPAAPPVAAPSSAEWAPRQVPPPVGAATSPAAAPWANPAEAPAGRSGWDVVEGPR